MSDLGRKDFSEKVTETVTPDSTKTTTETVHDNVTGLGDKIAREVQPEDHKSTTQHVSDTVGHTKDEHKHEHGGVGGMVDSVKHAVGMDKGHEHEHTTA